MIQLYTWGTPNGQKISIALEELGLPYEVHAVDIMHGQQFAPDFLAISPNNKIPAIVDDETGLSLFESGAILHYLAEKTGRLLPKDPKARWSATAWTFFQVGSVGPMLGQAGHFAKFAKEKIPYAIDRFMTEAHRLYGVIDKRLSEVEYLAGEYSIADIAVFPWVRTPEWLEIDASKYPHYARWRDAIAARPAVVRGLTIPVRNA